MMNNFLLKLAESKKKIKWEVENSGAIRGYRDEFHRDFFFFKVRINTYRYCPLTAAAGDNYMDYVWAGKKLNLNEHEIYEITKAADTYRGGYDKELRRKMLDVLDLN